jgi:hypothetical protein
MRNKTPNSQERKKQDPCPSGAEEISFMLTRNRRYKTFTYQEQRKQDTCRKNKKTSKLQKYIVLGKSREKENPPVCGIVFIASLLLCRTSCSSDFPPPEPPPPSSPPPQPFMEVKDTRPTDS